MDFVALLLWTVPALTATRDLVVKRPPEYQAATHARFRDLRGSPKCIAQLTEEIRRARLLARTRESDHFFRFVFAERFLHDRHSRIL